MLIIVPGSQTVFCGLQDHANVIKVELERIGLNVEICIWGFQPSIQPKTSILLEFTPLAYSRFGVSWPLLLQVLRWRLNGCRVITYFHELPFPNGRGLKKRLAVFVQQAYCSFLAAASAHSLVNQQQGRRCLQLLCGTRRVSFLPTCSNVGESDLVATPANRSLQVVIFGSPGKRRHAHSLVASLGGYRQLFGPKVHVIDIGEPLLLPSELVPEVKNLGTLSSAEIQEHLLASRFGFFYAEPNQFSKSGVFAAYSAHGVVPILSYKDADPQPFFLSPGEIVAKSSRFTDLKFVWHSCRDWYRQYSVRKCASCIYHLCHDI